MPKMSRYDSPYKIGALFVTASFVSVAIIFILNTEAESRIYVSKGDLGGFLNEQRFGQNSKKYSFVYISNRTGKDLSKAEMTEERDVRNTEEKLNTSTDQNDKSKWKKIYSYLERTLLHLYTSREKEVTRGKRRKKRTVEKKRNDDSDKNNNNFYFNENRASASSLLSPLSTKSSKPLFNKMKSAHKIRHALKKVHHQHENNDDKWSKGETQLTPVEPLMKGEEREIRSEPFLNKNEFEKFGDNISYDDDYDSNDESYPQQNDKFGTNYVTNPYLFSSPTTTFSPSFHIDSSVQPWMMEYIKDDNKLEKLTKLFHHSDTMKSIIKNHHPSFNRDDITYNNYGEINGHEDTGSHPIGPKGNKAHKKHASDTCYGTDDVLVVVAITCCLNFTFVLLIWAIVRWLSNNSGYRDFKQFDCEDNEAPVIYHDDDSDDMSWSKDLLIGSSNSAARKYRALVKELRWKGGSGTTPNIYTLGPDYYVPSKCLPRSFSHSMEDLRCIYT